VEDNPNPDGAIVADFVGGTRLPDLQAGFKRQRIGNRSDIIGEVKTQQPANTYYKKDNCPENQSVNQRTSQVRQIYRRRVAGLDRTHAQKIVGDGTNGRVGPFKAAIGEFYTGNVPLLSARSVKSMRTLASSSS